jgi:hypothetical protein
MDLGTRQYAHESVAHFVEPHSEQPGVIIVYKNYQYLSFGTHLNGYTAKVMSAATQYHTTHETCLCSSKSVHAFVELKIKTQPFITEHEIALRISP